MSASLCSHSAWVEKDVCTTIISQVVTIGVRQTHACAAISNFRNGERVEYWGNIVLHRDMFQKGTLMKTDLLRT